MKNGKKSRAKGSAASAGTLCYHASRLIRKFATGNLSFDICAIRSSPCSSIWPLAILSRTSWRSFPIWNAMICGPASTSRPNRSNSRANISCLHEVPGGRAFAAELVRAAAGGGHEAVHTSVLPHGTAPRIRLSTTSRCVTNASSLPRIRIFIIRMCYRENPGKLLLVRTGNIRTRISKGCASDTFLQSLPLWKRTRLSNSTVTRFGSSCDATLLP